VCESELRMLESHRVSHGEGSSLLATPQGSGLKLWQVCFRPMGFATAASEGKLVPGFQL
jgi:hypothetical protein